VGVACDDEEAEDEGVKATQGKRNKASDIMLWQRGSAGSISRNSSA